ACEAIRPEVREALGLQARVEREQRVHVVRPLGGRRRARGNFLPARRHQVLRGRPQAPVHGGRGVLPQGRPPARAARGHRPGQEAERDEEQGGLLDGPRGGARRGADAEAGCLRLQPRRLRLITWSNFVSQLFNGLALGALLALISSGLTIIYGTLGVLNLAHGAMFMLGGYAGWLAYTYTDSFIVAVFAGAIFVMLVGIVIELAIIRHFYKRPHEDQLLVTFGLSICL